MPPGYWVLVGVLAAAVVVLGATASGVVEWNQQGGADDEVLGATVTNTTPVPASEPPDGTPGPGGSTTSTTTDVDTTTTVPPTWEEVVAEVGPAVVRVESASCDGRGSGTGFLVGPDLVVTAAHVVEGTVLTAVMGDEHATSGRVIGIDAAKDVALVRVRRPFDIEALELSGEPAGVGEEIAALGYPQRQPRAATFGHVVAVEESSHVSGADIVLSGLVRHDANIHPGNSGGPIVGRDGAVHGLSVLGGGNTPGLAYAVPTAEAAPLLDEWRRTPAVLQPEPCVDGIPEANTFVSTRRPHPDADDIAETLQRWVDGINYGDYEAGWAQYSPAHQQRLPFTEFEEGFESSVVLAPEVWRIEEVSEDVRQAELTFFSYQAAADGVDGQTCTFWKNRYQFRLFGDGWKIDGGERLEDPGPC